MERDVTFMANLNRSSRGYSRSLIAVIITIALLRLIVTIFQLLVTGALNPLNHQEFELIFGMIMTLLIAMEFNHSILQTMERLHRIIQVKTVILISILALARKFIVLNMEVTPALTSSCGVSAGLVGRRSGLAPLKFQNFWYRRYFQAVHELLD